MFETQFRVRYYETDAMGIVPTPIICAGLNMRAQSTCARFGTRTARWRTPDWLRSLWRPIAKHPPRPVYDLVTVRVRMGAYPIRVELIYEGCAGLLLCHGVHRHAFCGTPGRFPR